MAAQNKSNLPTSTFKLGVQEHPLAEIDWYNIPVGVSLQNILDKIPENGGAETVVVVNGETLLDTEYVIKASDTVNVAFVPAALGSLAWYWVAAIYIGAAIIVGSLILNALPDVNSDDSSTDSFNRISGLSNTTPLYEPYQAVLGKRKIAPVYIARPFTAIEDGDEYFYALMSAGYGPLQLEDFRFGSVSIDDFDDGDVEVLVLDHYENTDDSELRDFWTNDIFQESISITLEEENGFSLQSSASSPDYIKTLFTADSGVFRVNDDGNKRTTRAVIRQDVQDINDDWWAIARKWTTVETEKGRVALIDGVYYLWLTTGETVNIDNTAWKFLNTIELDSDDVFDAHGLYYLVKDLDTEYFVESAFISSNSSEFNYTSIRVYNHTELWGEDYTDEIAVRARLESPTADEIEDDQISATILWDNIQTVRSMTDAQFDKAIGGDRTPRYIDGSPVTVFKPTIIGLKIKATGQLNGAVDNFYCDATMVVPQDKDADWTDWTSLSLEPSTNPADAYKWIMQGPITYRPIPHSKINEDALGEWRDRCDELYEGVEQWTISALLDSQTTMQETLNNIAYVGRAMFHFNDGKFSVIEKIEKTVPKQVFTARNSNNFQSKRIYPEVTDGIKVTFDSAEIDYEEDEIIFNDPSKTDADRKGRYTTTTMWGVDNYDQAYRLSRLAYYEELLRREIYTISVDVESLVCSRGDLVYIQNDIINVGTSAGRITSISGNTVFIDETIDADTISDGGLQIRNSTGDIVTTATTYLGDGEWLCTDAGSNTQVGDLVVYGELGTESLSCIVASITYDENMNANMTLYNAANEVFSYDENEIPVYNSSISTPISTEQPVTPVLGVAVYDGTLNLSVRTPYDTFDQNLKVYVQTRDYPEDSTAEATYGDSSSGWSYALQGEVNSLSYEISGLSRGNSYQVRAQFRSESNKASAWSNIEDVTMPLGEDLEVVEDLVYLHKSDGTYLYYSPTTFPDFDRYEVRTDTDFGNNNSQFVGDTKDNSYFLGLLNTDETYYVAVRNIYGAYSSPSTITVVMELPSDPYNFTATVEGFTVRLLWDYVTSAYAIDNYEIRYTEADVGDVFGSSVELSKFDALSVTHTTSQIGLYNYYVRAIDVAGQVSGWVNINVTVEFSVDNIIAEINDAADIISNLATDFDAYTITDIIAEAQGITDAYQNQLRIDEISTTNGDVAANITRIDSVEVDIEGNAQAISALLAGVTGIDDSAEAQLVLNSYFDEGGIGARAWLGVDVNNRISGINIDGTEDESVLSFIGDKVEFLRPDDFSVAFQWVDADDTFVFDGKIIATDSTFTGVITGTTINGGTINGTDIIGVDITGTSTITGAVVQTSTSGQRVILSGTEQKFYPALGTDYVSIDGESINSGEVTGDFVTITPSDSTTTGGLRIASSSASIDSSISIGVNSLNQKIAATNTDGDTTVILYMDEILGGLTYAGTSGDAGYFRPRAEKATVGGKDIEINCGNSLTLEVDSQEFIRGASIGSNSRVTLLYGGNAKLLTQSDGVQVNGILTETSDPSLKDFIRELDGQESLQMICETEYHEYTFKDQKTYGRGLQVGVNAMQAGGVFNNSIELDEEYNMSFCYRHAYIHGLSAIKELKSEVDKLKKIVAQLLANQ